jgi:hypothetical protein
MVYTFSLEFEGGLENFFFPKILQTFLFFFFFFFNLRVGTVARSATTLISGSFYRPLRPKHKARYG